MNKVSVLIVGGGASGMFCAIRLARFGISDVAIVERNDRLGRKLSATGNGQGNVTNENMSAAHYFSSTGSAAGVLQKFGKEQLLRAYLQAFDENYALWRRSGFMPIRERWLTHVVGLRQEIVVNFEHERETGIFEDIAPNGALLLRKGDGIIPVLAADIFYKEENKD